MGHSACHLVYMIWVPNNLFFSAAAAARRRVYPERRCSAELRSCALLAINCIASFGGSRHFCSTYQTSKRPPCLFLSWGEEAIGDICGANRLLLHALDHFEVSIIKFTGFARLHHCVPLRLKLRFITSSPSENVPPIPER